MRVIYRKIRHARYLYIKRNVEKVWGARYTLGARYLSKNTVYVMLQGTSALTLISHNSLEHNRINCTQHSPFWVANNRSTTQEIFPPFM